MTGPALALLLAAGSVFGVPPPYSAQTVDATRFPAQKVIRGALSVDLDGDGVDEFVAGVASGLQVRAWRDGGARYVSQHNLPPRFLQEGAVVRLGGVCDLDGDGTAEILFTVRSGDGWEQRLQALDHGRGILVLDVELPTGPDLRPDGVWDGNHEIIGFVDDGSRRLAVLERRTGFDRLDRAVVAYDLESGAPAWSHATAGNPHNSQVADLDGDGRPEIVVAEGSAKNRRPGEEVRGRLDDSAWIQALGRDGSLLWERRVAPHFADPELRVCDLDGDGRAEVVVFSRCASEGFANLLSVLDGGSGAVLDTAPVGASGHGVWAWREEDTSRGAVVCLLSDGRIVRYAWSDGRLQRVRTLRLNEPTAGLRAADFLPERGPEFCVVLGGNRMMLLSSDLDLLAEAPPLAGSLLTVEFWNLGPGTLLVYPNLQNGGQRFVGVPAARRYAGPAGAGAALLGAAILGGAQLRQRRRLRRLRRSSRADLLRAFLTARHGTVGPVGSLERVLWAAENPDPTAPGRGAEAWAACRREAVPDLEALLEKAAHIRLDPPLLGIVRRELANLGRRLDELVRLAPDDRRRAAVLGAARTSLGLVADGVKSLGATLAASCRVEVLPLVRRLVRRYGLRHPDVEFVLEEDAGPDLPPCLADAEDLEFALDNLLDNGARHARSGGRPEVRVAVARDPDGVVVRVVDTGPGVAAGDRERIFARGVSSRRGGRGVGLWHAREALRFSGGDLTVDEPGSGGASFRIRLRATGY